MINFVTSPAALQHWPCLFLMLEMIFLWLPNKTWQS